MDNLKNFYFVSIFTVAFGSSTIAYAGCSSAQVSGIWETAFSDGNSCRIRLKGNGDVDVARSVCFDPNRGTSDIDSGEIRVKENCFADGEIIIGGFTIELPVQFSHDRSTAAGRFRVTADGSKGSVVMIRVP